jgi:hypothetical protein
MLRQSPMLPWAQPKLLYNTRAYAGCDVARSPAREGSPSSADDAKVITAWITSQWREASSRGSGFASRAGLQGFHPALPAPAPSPIKDAAETGAFAHTYLHRLWIERDFCLLRQPWRWIMKAKRTSR